MELNPLISRLSDIDEFEESFKVMSVEDKTRHYYTLFRDVSPSESPISSPMSTPQHAQVEEAPAAAEDTGHNTEVEEDSLLEDEMSENLEEIQDVEDEEEEDYDDESTPHVGSETSKTQSPSSSGEATVDREEKIQIVIEDDKMEEEDEDSNTLDRRKNSTGDELDVKSGAGNSFSSVPSADSPRRDQVLKKRSF